MNRPNGYTLQDWLDYAEAAARAAFQSQLVHVYGWEGDRCAFGPCPPADVRYAKRYARVLGAGARVCAS